MRRGKLDNDIIEQIQQNFGKMTRKAFRLQERKARKEFLQFNHEFEYWLKLGDRGYMLESFFNRAFRLWRKAWYKKFGCGLRENLYKNVCIKYHLTNFDAEDEFVRKHMALLDTDLMPFIRIRQDIAKNHSQDAEKIWKVEITYLAFIERTILAAYHFETIEDDLAELAWLYAFLLWWGHVIFDAIVYNDDREENTNGKF